MPKRKEAPSRRKGKDAPSDEEGAEPTAHSAVVAAAAAGISAADNTEAGKSSVAQGQVDDPTTTAAIKAALEAGSKPAASVSSENVTDPSNFDHFLFKLLCFRAENQNFHVSRDKNPELLAWMQHLKREYKNHVANPITSALSADQMKVLEYLHVPLTSRGDDHWNRFFELLNQYHTRHGHVLVPRLCEVPGLGDWVTDQRRQYKAYKQGQSTQLTKERREKLDSLGFAWQVRNRPEWEHRYQELLEYKSQNGDCKVPQHYKENKPLGKWVAKQREQYKLLKKGQHSFLTPYRLERLNQSGFVWQVRTTHETDMVVPSPPTDVGATAKAEGGTYTVAPVNPAVDAKGDVEKVAQI